MDSYKTIHGKGIPSMLENVPCIARVATVSYRKVPDYSNLKILSPKQNLHRLPIALAQVKAGNTSKNLLNEIGQTIFYLYGAKEMTKKVYNNIINSIKL